MEPKEALGILSEATRKIQADRDSHQTWVAAVNVLAAAIAPKPVEKAKEPEKDVG